MANNKLSVRKIDALTTVGNYGDGGGLWLQVSKWQTKSWVFRFTIDDKRREMGLGSCKDVTLADARMLAESFRRMVRNGTDPIEARKAERRAKRAERMNIVTFSFCAEKYIDAHRHGWKNAKHAQQWTNTRASAWPAHELAAINAARIAGKSDDQIRRLVIDLIVARSAGCDL